MGNSYPENEFPFTIKLYFHEGENNKFQGYLEMNLKNNDLMIPIEAVKEDNKRLLITGPQSLKLNIRFNDQSNSYESILDFNRGELDYLCHFKRDFSL